MNRQVPWLRVFVEGVVIVVSILLAFGIEAWWDGRQDTERAEDYAVGLLEDAQTNLNRLDQSRSEAERQLEASKALGEWLKGDGDGADPDSVLTLLVASFGVARFSPTTQGYDQVVSAGDLGLLSEEVRFAMAAWNEAWLLYKNTEEQSQADRHQTFVPFLRLSRSQLKVVAPRDSLISLPSSFRQPARGRRGGP